MPDVLERLKACGEDGRVDRTLLSQAVEEMAGLRKRRDELELVLLMLVRTGWPWQEDGTPNGILLNCKDGYAAAMHDAKELLGLDHLSMITRTEPRT
ncbi:hypothetical protein [Geobacter sp. AOG1]|uniref:hypothetical protein n=1 Tax=Geobacter sp. AOG1 TaxID=1566346 RepID=UPI001CC3408A|nr:hypothetical protein [Geobacter sp. AOG1]GFE59301.1 hypothetical protein AOG1_31810 [Geobacter sp. AOG1]